MSTATDLAEIEAAIAENELDAEQADRLRELVEEGAEVTAALEQLAEEIQQANGEPPAAAQPEPVLGEPSDKQLRALDRENDRHIAKVRETMGAFVDGFTPCEKCDGLGLVPPGPQPQSHAWFIACPTCNGFGEVYTGSLRDGKVSRDCPACGGNGYLEALDPQGVPLANGGALTAAPLSPQPPPVAAPVVDGESPSPTAPTFGRPAWMGDPNIGG